MFVRAVVLVAFVALGTHGCDKPLVQDGAWRVGLDRYGPIQYGSEIAAVEHAVGRQLMDVSGRQPESCDFTSLVSGSDTVALMVVGRRIVRVDVQQRGIATDRGVQVGDPASRVKAIYGASLSVEPHKYIDGEYLIVTPASGGGTALVFETAQDTVINYRAGTLPEVRWVERCG